MELPIEWNPLEVARRLRCFFQELERDADLRYPEARLRYAIEIKLVLEERDLAQFADVLERFQRAKKKVSILDLPLLMEWNERKEQALCLGQILGKLRKLDGLDSDDPMQQRLEEIIRGIREESLSVDPSLSELIAFRWKFSALRDEARYLLSRLDSKFLANSAEVA